MLIDEAIVETGRASLYLAQLCRHLDQVGHGHAQMRAQVEWSDDHGVIGLPWGRCTLDAGPDGLTLRAEAPDAASLGQLRRVSRTGSNRSAGATC